MAQNDRVNEQQVGSLANAVRLSCLLAHLSAHVCACIFQQARDRYLASGFGHAMGFDSPPGHPREPHATRVGGRLSEDLDPSTARFG